MKNTLKELRSIHGYTQDAIAVQAGVSRQTINSIEREKYEPSLSLACKLARIFNQRIEDIFIYEEDNHETQT